MKIALITAYGGTNLGDAAIQEAVIYNIRKRLPEADVRLVTLNPEKTSQLHQISCFPITTLTVPYYSSGCSQKNDNGSNVKIVPNESELWEKIYFADIKVYLKRILGFSSLKWLFNLLVRIVHLPFVVHREILHFAEACKVMKGADIFVISGGGQIDDYWGGPWGHPYSVFKWGLIAKTVGARFVFLSVGTCTLESKLSVFFFHGALRMAEYRSYRDEVSKSLLKKFYFTQSDVVCPDLAWSFDRGKAGVTENQDKIPSNTVGVSPIAYLRHNWPKKDMLIYDNYLRNLAIFVTRLIRKGYSILFFITDGPDRHAAREIMDFLLSDETLKIREGVVAQVRIETIDELFTALGGVDYVVASRLHGVLLSHLARKPVLAISYDRKVNTYMSDMGFPQFCFDIHNVLPDLLETAFESLVAESDRITKKLAQADIEYSALLNSHMNTLFYCKQ